MAPGLTWGSPAATLLQHVVKDKSRESRKAERACALRHGAGRSSGFWRLEWPRLGQEVGHPSLLEGAAPFVVARRRSLLKNGINGRVCSRAGPLRASQIVTRRQRTLLCSACAPFHSKFFNGLRGAGPASVISCFFFFDYEVTVFFAGERLYRLILSDTMSLCNSCKAYPPLKAGFAVWAPLWI